MDSLPNLPNHQTVQTIKMTFPVEIRIGPAEIHAHLLFELLAYTLAYRYYVRLRRQNADPIGDEDRLSIFIGAAFGAFWGSHLLGVLERPFDFSKLTFLYFFANKTIAGGLLGGLAGVEITKKIIGVRVSSGDLMTYPLLLGMGIGRIGCHLEGLNDGTFGTHATLPWAVDFGDGIPRHPVNLYELFFLTGLGLFLVLLEKRKPLPDGYRFRFFMIAYLCYRFFAEYLKPAHFWPDTGLSSIQMACIGGLFYYAGLFGLFRRPRF
jgi:phosphatidylglycerol---prolipoprotein diacylglyceryl transferase